MFGENNGNLLDPLRYEGYHAMFSFTVKTNNHLGSSALRGIPLVYHKDYRCKDH